MPQESMLDQVADDLALWIDQISTQVAAAFVAARAPFSADLDLEQKLEFYRAQLFNPDGTPNVAGRNAQIQRLGTQGFTQVYKAVINRWPELRVPEPPPIQVPEQWPGAPTSGFPQEAPGPASPTPPPTGG